MPNPERIFLTAAATVAVNGKKIANATTHSISLRTNSGKTPTNDGLVISRGFKMGDLTIATLETVDGQQNALTDAALNDEILTCTFSHGNRTLVVIGTFDEVSKNSIVERGATEGSYKISGSIKGL